MSLFSKRSPWMLVVAALLLVHASQALIQGVSPGASKFGSAAARLILGGYVMSLWYFLGTNRVIAWRLLLGLYLAPVCLLPLSFVFAIFQDDEWWLKTWYLVSLCASLGFYWYYPLRTFLRSRAEFIAGDNVAKKVKQPTPTVRHTDEV